MNILSLTEPNLIPPSLFLPALGLLSGREFMSSDLLDLFYRGEYQKIVSETIDSSQGISHGDQAPAVISALTFLGRISEAELLFETYSDQFQLSQRVMARFFLGVVKCRHFHFQEARKYFGLNKSDVSKNLKQLAEKEKDTVLFYVYQGFGFYRYTYGHLSAAYHWAQKSYAASFRANFLFGRLFSQDLLAHVEVNLGKTHLGLKLIDQNIALAQNLGRGALIQMFKVTKAIYRSRFGISQKDAVEELLTTLSETVFEDGYSRACLLAELSQQYLIRGNAKKASECLNSACDYVYRVDNPRLEILLNFRMAALLARKGEFSQALHLLRSSLKRLEHNVDRLLELRLLGFECDLAERVGKEDGIIERKNRLSQLTQKTGYFVGKRILNRKNHFGEVDLNSLQDPLGDLMDGLKRESQECLTSILENGWLGYLYQYCQIDPCQKTVLLGLDGKSLTLFESGEVFHVSRGASNLVTKFFMCLASGEKTKEQIVKEVWEQNYHPLRHDPLIYSLVSKLRKELGNNASWIEATELGYQLQKGVSVKEFSPKQSSLSVPSTPQGLPVQSGIQPGITYRQQQLLALTAKLKSIDVKTCVAHFKISTATANRDLAFLETHGMLFRTGKGRSTQYHVENLKEEVS